jgi:hypothetical protein
MVDGRWSMVDGRWSMVDGERREREKTPTSPYFKISPTSGEFRDIICPVPV